MTVKTDFSREDVIKILSNYKLGDFIDFNYISEGTVQTNLLIKTTGEIMSSDTMKIVR